MHDLRHTAATIMISEGVPIVLVSKILRRSTLATTVNLYGHLLKYAAHDTVAALASALDRADGTHIRPRHRPAPPDARPAIHSGHMTSSDPAPAHEPPAITMVTRQDIFKYLPGYRALGGGSWTRSRSWRA